MKRYVIFWGIVLTVLFFVSAAAVSLQAAIPAEERAALIALYNATNGDGWNDNSGWKTPPLDADGFAMPGTEESWYGIILEGNLVSQINLSDNKLTGSIPPELGNLSNLRELYLPYNQLSGSIPSELGNLSNLEHLYLRSNQLSGNIPPELGNLSNLDDLNLHDNQFSGGGTLNWTAGVDASWLTCTPMSGTGSGVFTISADHTGFIGR